MNDKEQNFLREFFLNPICNHYFCYPWTQEDSFSSTTTNTCNKFFSLDLFLATFPDLKSAIFGLKSGFLALYLKVAFKKSILIICHFRHFSLSTLFLNVALYTLSSISAPSNFTPYRCAFFVCLFLFWFC